MRRARRSGGGGGAKGGGSIGRAILLALIGIGCFAYAGQSPVLVLVGLAIFAYLFLRHGRKIWKPMWEKFKAERLGRARAAHRAGGPQMVAANAADPQMAVRDFNLKSGGGAFLGFTPDEGEWIAAAHESAVLVLGPPRSGKTSGVIIPTLLCANGPVVSTSTKLDVLEATQDVRARFGRVWHFDPSGSEVGRLPERVEELRWSPVPASRKWDKARTMADAMVGASPAGTGTENATHWSESAKALLAPMLHAAALSDRSIADVRRWILNSNFEEPGLVLTNAGAELAADDLSRIAKTESRERSGIVSTTSIVLQAYGSEAALAKCKDPNFDAQAFVQSQDTIYVSAPSNEQSNAAPLIVGLLDEIRDATFARHRASGGQASRGGPVVWALDEIANIAPLKNLPGLVSEAGGQGIHILACFQDLSQASVRWGPAADGFLSLFGTKVIFPGIGDKKTLDALSTLVGDWDRPYSIQTSGKSYSFGGTTRQESTQETTKKEAQLSAGDIANLPLGFALTIKAGRWGLVELTPYFSALPWTKVSGQIPSNTSAEL